MITSAVVFDHRGRAKRGQPGIVEVRITISRKSIYISTGISVLKQDFLDGTIINHSDANVLNERIRIIHERILEEVNEMLKYGHELSTTSIKQRLVAKKVNKENTMIDWMEDQLYLLQHEEGTMKHYRTLVLRLKEFGQMTTWQDVTVENLYTWDAWLHGLNGWRGQKISDGAVYNYHKCFKALIHRAVKFGIMPANPYDRIRGEFKRGDAETVEYLTEDQMHAIEQLPVLAGSLIEKCRDLFVFQMYTGLAYSDAITFDIQNYRQEDGMWTYVGERVKTGVSYISRLLPPAVAVLEKYGMTIPKIDNHVYNNTLKVIGIAVGISFPLHSHIARHTFATYMLNHKISLDSVSVMLGHTNTVQTRRYAKTLAQTVRDDFDRIAKQLKK